MKKRNFNRPASTTPPEAAKKIQKKPRTKPKVAEENLSESETKYRLLFNSGNDAIFVFHPEKEMEKTFFIEVNDVACRKLGYTREELLKMTPGSICDQSQQHLFPERLKKLLTDKHILYEDELSTKTGTAIPVEISAHLFEFNRKATVMAIARDITSRRRAESQLRDQAALLDKAQDAILVCDLNNYIIYWNKSAERLYGWKTQEAIGTNVFDLLFRNNSNQFGSSRRAILNRGEWQGELHQVTREGKDVIVESRWTLVHDHQGEAKSILMVNTDITEKKRIENQFLQAQRMESIGALAGGIAHDLNNILAPMLTAVQILQLRMKDKKSLHILETIEKNVKRGAEMVKQILAFARGVEGERIPLQLDHLLHEVQSILHETFPKSIEIEMDVAPCLWTVSGDATQLQQVLLNLCVNARDAMPDGGKLSIKVSNKFVDENYARMHLSASVGHFVLISVTDTGVGIPPEIKNKIFEPFFTTKEVGKGTGLGLSTVVGIVNSHGGFLNVVSTPGEGSRFEVYLPASEDAVTVENSSKQDSLPRGDGELILVVDDEISVLDITRETLLTYGYRVMVAKDGAEAIGLFAAHRSEIKVVITDMIMPIMDGAATVRALRTIDRDIKIIVSSGFLDDSRKLLQLQNGVDGFLQKPYTARKLLSILHEVLNTS